MGYFLDSREKNALPLRPTLSVTGSAGATADSPMSEMRLSGSAFISRAGARLPSCTRLDLVRRPTSSGNRETKPLARIAQDRFKTRNNSSVNGNESGERQDATIHGRLRLRLVSSDERHRSLNTPPTMKFNGCCQFGQRALTILRRIRLLIRCDQGCRVEHADLAERRPDSATGRESNGMRRRMRTTKRLTSWMELQDSR